MFWSFPYGHCFLLGNHAHLLKWNRSVTIPAFSSAGPTGLHRIWWTLLIPYTCEGTETPGRTLPQYFTIKAAKAHELKWCSAGTWGFAVWVLTCFRAESQAAIWAKKQKKKIVCLCIIMCLQTVAQAGDLQISPQIATIESRSMNGRGQADAQVCAGERYGFCPPQHF